MMSPLSQPAVITILARSRGDLAYVTIPYLLTLQTIDISISLNGKEEISHVIAETACRLQAARL